MTIEYYIQNNYGKDLAYVADEKLARYVSDITGIKTLSGNAMNGLKNLGVEFKEIFA